MIMTLMTLHDQQKQKYSAHILRRLGGCFDFEDFWKNSVLKGLEEIKGGLCHPSEPQASAAVGPYCF